MYCTRKVTDDLIWVGADDRRLAMFEGVYSVPDGVSYNSYLYLDEKTILFDTVDKAVTGTFLENVRYALNGRNLDYIVVQHMEPDHSASLEALLTRYPGAVVVCNKKTETMIHQFFGNELQAEFKIVKEGDVLSTGKHQFTFLMAPMVHWPEVMVTYELTTKTLFSADAFGTFGALNGALFADEVDFFRDYIDEARRYYTNIVGKYGTQVQALLKKASTVEIETICPLHGFVWRSNIGDYLAKYQKWSRYEPEVEGVMIAYASVYGNTENVANILACKLRDAGIKTTMFDVSVTASSEVVAAAFEYSHLVFASTTYNAGIFITMDELLRDLAAHNIQNRTVAFIENGSWAPASGSLMKGIIGGLKGMNVIEKTLTVKSSLHADQYAELTELADAIIDTFPKKAEPVQSESTAVFEQKIDNNAFFKLSYGLFVLTAKDNDKDNGCIINTVTQLTDEPKRITIAVNKQNLTHDMIMKTGVFNVSVLSQDVPFKIFQHFGFQSGRDTDKFAEFEDKSRSDNGLYYLNKYSNAFLSARVIETKDYGTHTLFIADIEQAEVLSDIPSVTYAYYFDHIKPKPQPADEKKKGFVCKICGYVYEGEELPADFICPWCKHGAADFEPL
ncbi:MAG: flavin reductase [Clostridia bacterium]|nr:flavin reductase [Clostridia bacterium]MDY5555136.1 flavin reductase [Blautia sp.]